MTHSMPNLRSLTLTVTERCNLRCSYCYVPVHRGRDMDDHVADAAVDLFASHAAAHSEVSLSFFGGEPFLCSRLMKRATERVRGCAPRGQKVRVVTPTNALLLRGEALEFCRDAGIELAVSIDGLGPSGARPYPNGASSIPDLLARLPEVLSLDPEAHITARMTVTPDNVGELAATVRELARLGFRRIFYLPAYEIAWSDEAVAIWKREHVRIGTWLIGASGAGLRLPDLPTWRGVESRLLLGRPRSACGAGDRIAAVATDGRIFPCYRFVSTDSDKWQIGHVDTGFDRPENIELFASLNATHVRPENDDCATCTAKDGCTHFCAALGCLMLDDPLGVPETVCRLMRAQVEAIRPYAGVQRRPVQRAPAPRWATAAFMAAAMASACANTSCGGSTETTDTVPGDASIDFQGAGVCAQWTDAQPDVQDNDGQGMDVVAGVCPVGYDSSADDSDGGPDTGDEFVAGICAAGICDYADTGSDDAIAGICPHDPDSSTPGMC